MTLSHDQVNALTEALAAKDIELGPLKREWDQIQEHIVAHATHAKLLQTEIKTLLRGRILRPPQGRC